MSDLLRPRFHFSPRQNWINDPNGLVWLDGEYHLFFQYNPHGDVWGHMSWGHAVSPDLTHWQELPVAIPEDADWMAFSGSIVVDHHNTAGLAAPGETALVALYTGSAQRPPEHQVQNLAWSVDRGRTWTKWAGNPVLDLGVAHFRDPKVFWHGPSARWVMLTVRSDLRMASFYGSVNLRDWTHLSDFGPTQTGDGIWECPDLIPLTLPAQGSAAERLVWVLKIDIFEGHVAGSAGARVWFGEFDGVRFQADDGQGAWVDWGMDFYAAASWANLPASAGQAVWLGWLDNHVYARELPTAPWRGQMSVPRTLSLGRSADGLELLQQPVPAITARRGALLLELRDQPIHGYQCLALPEGIDASALDIELVLRFAPDSQASAGLVLRASAPGAAGVSGESGVTGETRATGQSGVSGEAGDSGLGPASGTWAGYQADSARLFLDRAHSGFLPTFAPYAGRRHAPYPRSVDGVVRLRVLLDASSVEVFTQDGRRWISERIIPAADSLSLYLWSSDGPVYLDVLRIFPMA